MPLSLSYPLALGKKDAVFSLLCLYVHIAMKFVNCLRIVSNKSKVSFK